MAKKTVKPKPESAVDLDWWNSLTDIEKYQLNTWFMMAGNNGADIPAPENLPTVHVPHPNEVAAWSAWLEAENAWLEENPTP